MGEGLNDRDQTTPRAICICPPHQNCVVGGLRMRTCNLETRIPLMKTRTSCASSRGVGRGVRRVIGTQTYWHVLPRRVRALAGHAQDFSAHVGRVKLQCTPTRTFLRRWKHKKTITLTHALPAPCHLVRRSSHGVSASHVPVTS